MSIRDGRLLGLYFTFDAIERHTKLVFNNALGKRE